jgi:hypothetical protein
MRTIAGSLALTSLALLIPLEGSAQLQSPTTWRWRTDAPAAVTNVPDEVRDSTFAFVEMPPGWHVTMGPGGVLYDPRYFADGAYSIESQIYHFPNSTNAEYGFAVGGRQLEGQQARYVAFVARADGSVAAWEQQGSERRMLSDWKHADAVVPNDGKAVVGNLFRLSVSGGEAILRANGLDVLIVPLEGLALDGQFGFRVGPGVNLHVATYTVQLQLAPARR